MHTLIVTGDDFGLAVPVNEAIETAHVRGILTAASLMVGAGAVQDALQRARRHPTLRVGLHLVVVEGRPVLPAKEIPDLVDAAGDLPADLVRAGVRFFFLRRVRQQLEREIRAQFEAFRRTGLALDHVNAHNHMHLHPTVLGLILKIGREYGMRAVRVPHEPLGLVRDVADGSAVNRFAAWLCLTPWVASVRRRLRRAEILHNDFIVGLSDSGRMHAERVLRLLQRIPDGVTEMYFHPSTARCPELDRTMPDYEHRQEFDALINPEVMAVVQARGMRRIAYADL
jgi:hopanoid biosynthesis associated protein HpnK